MSIYHHLPLLHPPHLKVDFNQYKSYSEISPKREKRKILEEREKNKLVTIKHNLSQKSETKNFEKTPILAKPLEKGSNLDTKSVDKSHQINHIPASSNKHSEKKYIQPDKKQQEDAVIRLQRFYRQIQQKEKFQLILEKKRKLRDKIFLAKRILFLVPHTLKQEREIPEELQDYYLTVYALPLTKELSFHLANIRKKTQFDYRTTIAHLNLILSNSRNSKLVAQDIVEIPENLQLLRTFADKIVSKFYIVDHILTLRELEMPDEANSKNYAHHDPQPSSETSVPLESYRQAQVSLPKEKDVAAKEIKIKKIQAFTRGYLARSYFKLLKMKKSRVICQQGCTIEDNLAIIKIVRKLNTNEMIICGINYSNRQKFQPLKLPDRVLDFYSGDFYRLIQDVIIFFGGIISLVRNSYRRENNKFQKRCRNEIVS